MDELEKRRSLRWASLRVTRGKGHYAEDIAAQTHSAAPPEVSRKVIKFQHRPIPSGLRAARNLRRSRPNRDSDQLRTELGGQRPAAAAKIFEPADSTDLLKWLVFGAIAAGDRLVLVMTAQ
jgi:hypothetical protein